MHTPPLYAVITPVRDEANHIRRTLESMEDQTVRPLCGVIVDDGSTDGTGALLDTFAGEHDWVEVEHRPDRGRRAAGGGVMEAFHAGLAKLKGVPWDYLVKLDGDLSFEPDYFERCLAQFEADPALGIGGGTVCAFVNAHLEIESAGDPPFHVRGATKIYRRVCFEAIGPLIQAPGWDTLDEVQANRLGWKTRTFADLALLQHKPTGSADGCWKNAFKNGRANYFTGYHPAFVLAKCAKRIGREPFGVESAGLFAGYFSGYLKRLPHLADADTVRYLRGQQMRRLLQQDSIYGPARTSLRTQASEAAHPRLGAHP
jgi:glycosyltransferase involved in cell wall biosynthesis